MAWVKDYEVEVGWQKHVFLFCRNVHFICKEPPREKNFSMIRGTALPGVVLTLLLDEFTGGKLVLL